MQTFQLLRSLRNPIFARLYTAQVTNLLGDALTWLGLALLAFEEAGNNSAVVLSGALTLRVTAFVLLSPFAGVLADRLDRKTILVTTHLARMGIVSLLPFVNAVWQIYAIVFALNVFYAFFTPTYQATIPLVTGQEDYPQAIALSSATFQLLGVLGPGIAGAIAAFVGARQVFFLDAFTFLIAAILIITLPGQLRVEQAAAQNRSSGRTWQDIQAGTTRLFADRYLRYALAMQLVTSVTGAMILVNTVGYVQGVLKLGSVQYGWVMGAFGIGATLAAATVGSLGQHWTRTTIILLGASLITTALLPASYVKLPFLLVLWLVAGAGQTLVNVSAQTLIADRTPTEFQGRVYGAQFAWSHLWWLFSYPLAGWLGSYREDTSFLYGSLFGLVLLVMIQLILSPKEQKYVHKSYWHEHEHTHDEHHRHEHHPSILVTEPHRHPHQHGSLRHAHAYSGLHHHYDCEHD
ncbi:MFS transporter [Gloeocapsa sp. BRSZ]|uniref:MFS transporter n=1 Tax=Gloeocapsopsis sp. IPPAS B-1203 TaxID=2049454 RepID=UPI000C1873F3|nr:MFS transporter [Gloeocapsopsis sp. IPPAS B-1203]PIG91616.1 MFS transporter [Gloeocapsopsis sp. IPPAS B-1203]